MAEGKIVNERRKQTASFNNKLDDDNHFSFAAQQLPEIKNIIIGLEPIQEEEKQSVEVINLDSDNIRLDLGQ